MFDVVDPTISTELLVTVLLFTIYSMNEPVIEINDNEDAHVPVISVDLHLIGLLHNSLNIVLKMKEIL